MNKKELSEKTKEELRMKLYEGTSGEIVNEMYKTGLSLGRIKERKIKEGWKRNIVRFRLNHFNSDEERWKVFMTLTLSLLTEEELDRFPF